MFTDTKPANFTKSAHIKSVTHPVGCLSLLTAITLMGCQPNQTTSSTVNEVEPIEKMVHQEQVKQEQVTKDDPALNEVGEDNTYQQIAFNRSAFEMTDSGVDLYFANHDVSISDDQRQAVASFITQIDNSPAIRYDVTGYYDGDIPKETATQRANAVVVLMLDAQASKAGLGMYNIRIHMMEKTSDHQADVSVSCC